MNLTDLLIQSKNTYSSKGIHVIYPESLKNNLSSAKERKQYLLISQLMSYHTSYNNYQIKFKPTLTLTLDDLQILPEELVSTLPVKMQFRIAEIIWILNKNLQSGRSLINIAIALIQTDASNINVPQYLDFALCIAQILNLNKESTILHQCTKKLWSQSKFPTKETYDIKLINTIIKHNILNFNTCNKTINYIINHSFNDPFKVESAYKVKEQLYKQHKKLNKLKNIKKGLANYYEHYIYNKLNDASITNEMLEEILKKAIHLFRKTKNPTKANALHHELQKIQLQKLNSLRTIELKINKAKINKYIQDNFSNITLLEAIIRLIFITPFISKNAIITRLKERQNNNYFFNIIPISIIGNLGEQIITLPALVDINLNIDSKERDLLLHHELYEEEKLLGSTLLFTALSYIRDNFIIQKEDIKKLISNNPIIPSQREDLFIHAILSILKGDFISASHIIPPQLECLFRELARELNDITITLEPNSNSKAKVLSSILNAPNLNDAYDNNILFIFKGLLNEPAGANIRNNIAHGLVNTETIYQGDYIYLYCVFIKLISMYSPLIKKELDYNPSLLNIPPFFFEKSDIKLD